jgi:hypothetical protein
MKKPNPNVPTKMRLVRNIEVVMSLAIWLFAFVAALRTSIPQIFVVALVFLGFTPYLLALHVLEPWLARRNK